MIICWFITILLLLQSCAPGDGIVGGYVSIPHSRPYMVYIQDSRGPSNGSLRCSGFLVREDFVMTTAHCKAGNLKVHFGFNDTAFLPDGIEVDSFPHPDFKNNPGRDIMLLKLKTPATLNETVSIIALPKPWNEKISKDCLIMGWGFTNNTYPSPSRVLKELNMTLEELTSCLDHDILCSTTKGGPGNGDSGGPLVCGDIAQGIVSFKMASKANNMTSGYTLISQHLLWINKVMKASPLIKPGTKTRSPVTKQVENEESTSTERPTSESAEKTGTESHQRLNICLKTWR